MDKHYDKFKYSFSLRSPAQSRSNSFTIVRKEVSTLSSYDKRCIDEAEKFIYDRSYNQFYWDSIEKLIRRKNEAEAYKCYVDQKYDQGCMEWSSIRNHTIVMLYDDEALATMLLLKELTTKLESELRLVDSGCAATVDIDHYYKAISFCQDHIEELEEQGNGSSFPRSFDELLV